MEECRWDGITPLVLELVRVAVEPPLRRHGGLVQVVALVAALAGLDEHHGPAEALAVRTGEGHAGRASAAWRAAAAVPAHAAVVGPVEAGAPAAGVGQTVGLRGLVGTRALPPSLHGDRHGAAGPNVAQACLLDQLTPGIVIGNTRGNAHPTAPGALGPGSGLNHTLVSHLPPGCQVLVSTGLVPLAPQLHQLVAQGVFLLFGFVREELAERLGVGLRVRVSRVGNEGVGRVSRELGSPVRRGHHGGPLVAVDAEAALARHFDQLRRRTGRGRQRHVAGTERHAPHRPVDAGALVLATGTEILPVLVNAAVVLAGTSLRLCPADAVRAAHVVAIVALQPFVVVAGTALVAVLVELGGAHLAAAASVGDGADPRGARRGARRALAHNRTVSHHHADCSSLPHRQ